jgi:hypothetical protein
LSKHKGPKSRIKKDPIANMEEEEEERKKKTIKLAPIA